MPPVTDVRGVRQRHGPAGPPGRSALPAGEAGHVKVHGTDGHPPGLYVPSPPDPVTGKSVPSMVDRYYVPGTNGLAIVSLSTPNGVDNVDAFRQMIQSFKWQ